MTLFYMIFSGMVKKMPLSKRKTTRLCTLYSHLWTKYLALQLSNFCLFIKYWYAKRQLCLSYVISQNFSKTDLVKKHFTLLGFELYDKVCPNSRIIMERPKKYDQQTQQKTPKMRKMYTSIMSLYTSQKIFILSWSTPITIIY